MDRLLTAAEGERANRFAFPHLRRRYRVGRAALRRVLAERLGGAPVDIEIRVRSGGKPYVPGGPEFNTSSSGPWVLIGLGNDIDLGVDIELLREMNDMRDLARRYFSKRECEELDALPQSLYRRGFFRAWSRKEAVSKALGLGLAMDFRSFSVPLDAIDACSPVARTAEFPGDREWFVRPLSLIDEAEAAVAANQPFEIGALYRIGPDLRWAEEALRQ
jgi:4'-phosphopantetheinyl transferase